MNQRDCPLRESGVLGSTRTANPARHSSNSIIRGGCELRREWAAQLLRNRCRAEHWSASNR
jgi:hypothetical protein